MTNFNTEKEMGIRFSNYIRRINKNSFITLLAEQKKLFGIPDFVVIEKNNESVNLIVSIELKLSNWQRALKQAFRYKTFSNLAFIILDEMKVHNALKEIELFELYNIGLASFNIKNEIKIYFYPKVETPYNEKFSENIIKTLDGYQPRNESNNSFTIQNFLNRFHTKFDNKNVMSVSY